MIHVVAIITAKPGQRGAVLDAFKAILPSVHAEAGCIEYQPVIDVADAGSLQTKLGDDSFIVVEKWASLEALTAHAAAPHMAAYAEKTKSMLASRAVHVLTEA